MDPDLNLGLPICPPHLSIDLADHDLPLDSLPFSSSGIDDVLMPIPSTDDALLPSDEAFDLSPSFSHSPSIPSEARTPNAVPLSQINSNEHLDRIRLSALPRELLDCPELRFHRLFECLERRQLASDDSDNLIRNIRRSGRLVGKGKTADKAPEVEVAVEVKEKREEDATDFDCNICLQLSREPVVTCCGHMFCWPCLYQWIYVHCDYRECPVCKGKLNDDSMVPIYGRGGSEARASENGDRIPPRPRANRAEGWRQPMQSPPILPRPEFRSESWFREVQELFYELPDSFRFVAREVRRSHHPVAVPPVAQAMTTYASSSAGAMMLQGEQRSTERRGGTSAMVLRSRPRSRSAVAVRATTTTSAARQRRRTA